ncbi:MAG TPA: RDD family protein [Aquihabitans sp.]|jgi:uncharacterized RDD family membrane protein YckC|nr:RDD family protein [Aquihabitans sp.]
MSDVSQGPGWWQASDGKWYPPEQAPAAAAPTAPPTAPPPGYGPPAGAPAYGPPGTAPAYGAPAGSPGYGAPAASHGQLAEWPERAASGAIDFVALGVIGAIVQQVSYGLGLLISLAGLAFGIYNGYLNGSTGQSVGKRVVGTRVVAEATGQPIGGGQGIIRYFSHIIDGIICGIGYLFPLWDAKKQTIGDKIMKTVVLTGQPKQSFGDAIKPS